MGVESLLNENPNLYQWQKSEILDYSSNELTIKKESGVEVNMRRID
ncbi:hypothetical protein GO491_07205 [Flavobacteriaceae bacterium Ap0902]|nr:hypothetical protein [Flavobacteriaceae bacterium Ap0902]